MSFFQRCWLSVRLIRGSGPRGWIRVGLMSSGVAAIMIAALTAWSVPHGGSAAEARLERRAPRLVYRATRSTFLVSTADDAIGLRPLHRVDVAGPRHGQAPAPPGCRQLPAPGSMCASPALIAMARSEPDVGDRLHGAIRDVIAPEGLTGPDELLVYVGHRRTELETASPAAAWGTKLSSAVATTRRLTSIELAVLVLVPAALFLAVSARLSSAERARRSGQLHLLGVDARDIERVAGTDAWLAGLLGGAVGVVAHAWLVPLVAHARWVTGERTFPADGRPSVVSASVLVVVLAWTVARIARAGTGRSLRRSTTRVPVMASMWRVVPVWLSSLLLVGYLVDAAGSARHAQGAIVVLVAAFVAIAGTVFALRPLVERVAARIANRTNRMAVRLGCRRVVWDASSAVRVLSASVALVLVASVGTGVLRDADLVRGPSLPAQPLSIVVPEGSSQATRDRIASLPSLSVLARVRSVPQGVPGAALSSDLGAAQLQIGVSVTYGSCRTLSTLLHGPHSRCDPGVAYRLTQLGGGSYETTLPVGAKLQLDADERAMAVRVPAATMVAKDLSSTPFGPNEIFVADMSPAHGWPSGTTFEIRVRNSDRVIRDAQRRLAAIDPQAHADLSDVNLPAIAAYRANRGAITLGLIAGGTLSILSLWIAALDRAFERRSNVAALAVVGIRRGELRWSQLVQLLVPAAIGLGLAAVVGSIVGSAYLVAGGLQRGWYPPVVVVSVVAAFAGTVLACVTAWITLGYELRPELLRSE